MEKHVGGRTAGPESHSWVRVALAVPPGDVRGVGRQGQRVRRDWGGRDRKGSRGEGAEGRTLPRPPADCPSRGRSTEQGREVLTVRWALPGLWRRGDDAAPSEGGARFSSPLGVLTKGVLRAQQPPGLRVPRAGKERKVN